MANDTKPSQSPRSEQSLDDLKAFWTPERMKDAVPAPSRRPDAGVKRVRREITQPSEESQHRSPPQRPRREPPIDDARATFSAVPVADAMVFPFSTVGKLFYTQNGMSYEASAAVISGNTLLTAAHALFDFPNQQWAQNLLFAPAYWAGRTPLGTWGVSVSYTLPGYNTTGNDSFDVGMATTTPQNIADITGSLGLIVNQGWNGLVWQALGYPASPYPPYDGTQMWSLTGPSTGLDPDGTIAVGMRSNFAEGASGGPWLLGGATANGLNSYGHPTSPNIEYSPYFDSAVWQMFLDVRS
ncbi:MAG: hypothetical protein AAGN46_00260 [Acidobacteriota bacterium]